MDRPRWIGIVLAYGGSKPEVYGPSVWYKKLRQEVMENAHGERWYLARVEDSNDDTGADDE